MGKKNRRKGEGEEAGAPPAPLISRRGWKVIGGGILVVALGFVVLSFTDPGGRNWASRISPFLIIGGYAAIGAGILVKDSPQTPKTAN